MLFLNLIFKHEFEVCRLVSPYFDHIVNVIYDFRKILCKYKLLTGFIVFLSAVFTFSY